MLVKDLIEKLKQYPENFLIWTEDNESDEPGGYVTEVFTSGQLVILLKD